MALQDEVTEAYIKRTITLLRAAEGEAISLAKRLKQVNDIVTKELVRRLGSDLLTKSEVKAIQAMVGKKLSVFYNQELPKELEKMSAEVIAKEISWNQQFLAGATSGAVANPILENALAKAKNKTYQGKRFATWTNKLYPAHQKQMNAVLRMGFLEGKGSVAVARDMKNILGTAERNLKTIARSHFMHNAREARQSVYQVNPELVEGKIWVSTLDEKTTPLICGIRDQKEYNMNEEPVGHSLPWDAGPGAIHWNCRSTDIPKLAGGNKTVPRAATGAGENYVRGDNTTRTGKVRKHTKANREKGFFKTKMVTTKTNYESFLRQESKKNIDFVSDILGSKEKARMFRDGKISLLELGLQNPVARPINLGSI